MGQTVLATTPSSRIFGRLQGPGRRHAGRQARFGSAPLCPALHYRDKVTVPLGGAGVTRIGSPMMGGGRLATMTKRRRHTPEQVIRKLREGERPLGERAHKRQGCEGVVRLHMPVNTSAIFRCARAKNPMPRRAPSVETATHLPGRL